MNELNMAPIDPLDRAASPNDAEQLLAEMELVFAEVVAGAESRTDLTAEQRGQAQLVIRETMDSTRRMVERFASAKLPSKVQP